MPVLRLSRHIQICRLLLSAFAFDACSDMLDRDPSLSSANESLVGRDDAPDPAGLRVDDMTVYFPTQSSGDHEYDSGAPIARLVLDDSGCLRAGEDGPVIIWPYSGYTIDLVDDEIALISEDTGNVIAPIGDEVSFHGSDPEFPMDTVPDHMLLRPLPEACADAEGYFITGPGIRLAD